MVGGSEQVNCLRLIDISLQPITANQFHQFNQYRGMKLLMREHIPSDGGTESSLMID